MNPPDHTPAHADPPRNLHAWLSRAADEEQLRLRPLPEHAAAAQEEHLRRHYALLLAAILTAQPAVSATQTRLLRLLLDALKLGDIRAALFEEARTLDDATLLEAARLVRQAGFAEHLLLDALVLLRLDTPLDDDCCRLLGELAAFLGLDETALATRADDTLEILGLNMPPGDAAPAATSQTGADDSAATPAAQPPSLAELWPGRLRQPLTVEALRAGLQGGLWLLDANLEIDFPWQATNAILVFRRGATLNTFAREGEIRLTACRLFDAALAFQGACRITVQGCHWQGDYDPAAKRTALHSAGAALTVTDCEFSTRNARTILVTGATLTVTGSRFNRCGHPNLAGGAIESTATDDYYNRIENCRFFECQGSSAGAMLLCPSSEVENCEFVACRGYFHGKRDVAVRCDPTILLGTALYGCVFRKSSIALVNNHFSSVTVAFNTQFIEANIYCTNSSHTEISNCSFTNGRIEEVR